MISDKDRLAISQLGSRYKVARILLFGSGARPGGEAHDIDLAVEGLPPEQFFRFYGDLILALSKPVDLIDLRRDTKFHHIIRREGIPVYVRPEGTD